MQLSSHDNTINPKVKAIRNAVALINESLQTYDAVLTHKHRESASDAIAILNALEAKIDTIKPEFFKESTKKAARLTKAAFSEDFAPLNFREEIKESQKNLVTPVKGKNMEPVLELGSTYPETNGFDTPKRTASPYSPARMAEIVVRDLGRNLYQDVGSAFTGYIQEHGPYGMASSIQKYELGRQLQAWGFIIDIEPLEKAAETEKKAYLKRLEEIKSKVRNASATEVTMDSAEGLIAVPEKKVAFQLSKYSQLDQFAPSAPNVLDITKNKLKSIYDTFHKALLPADINKAFYDALNEAQVDPQEFNDPQEKQVIVTELKQFLRDNQIPVVNQINQQGELKYAFKITHADMKCMGCGAVQNNMYRMADDQACPKCGGKMIEANAGEQNNSMMPNNLPSDPGTMNSMTGQSPQGSPAGSMGNSSIQIY